MGKRKLSPNELRLVVFPQDLDEDNRPTKVHVVRNLVASRTVSRTPCGLGDQIGFQYPFLSWILHNAPLCSECKRAAQVALEGEAPDFFEAPSSNTGQNSGDSGADDETQ